MNVSGSTASLLLLVALMAACLPALADGPATFVGAGVCAGCHAAETALWRGSDHDKAMAVATDATPRWGRMDFAQMLAHLSESVRMALGELPVTGSGPKALKLRPIRHAVIYWLPWPKGAPTAPSTMAGQSSESVRIRTSVTPSESDTSAQRPIAARTRSAGARTTASTS